jgi:hypothetical protein
MDRTEDNLSDSWPFEIKQQNRLQFGWPSVLSAVARELFYKNIQNGQAAMTPELCHRHSS